MKHLGIKRNLYVLCCIIIISISKPVCGQSYPGIFNSNWKPKVIANPVGKALPQTNNASQISINIDAGDTINKVSKYIFGGNLNPYSPVFIKTPRSLDDLKNLSLNVLRWPGGNLSNEYFWNATPTTLPTDLPNHSDAGQSTQGGWWVGTKPGSSDLSIDDYYRILEETGATGSICVNYSYARYGLSPNAPSVAAHLAADWVRFDKGRTRFWEIGNENYGNWQTGYKIKPELYMDPRPEYISGEIYGGHCRIFIDSMRQAASEVGAEIYIGVQAWEDYTSWDPIQTAWNDGVMPRVGDKADFIIVHNYYTPYEHNSDIPTIFKSLEHTPKFAEVVGSKLKEHGFNPLPVALTEYNIQCRDSGQLISYINGMHATMVLGDALRYGFGMANRWSTVGFWGGVGDMGTFSYGGEPGVPEGNMRPEFYYLYHFQKYFGDVMIKSTSSDTNSVVSYASTFRSGQSGIVLVNKKPQATTAEINLDNFKTGANYHYYLLTGGDDNGSFSGRVFVNGQGSPYIKGGPSETYPIIKPYTTPVEGKISIDLPAYSTIFMLVEGAPKPEFKSAVIDENPFEIKIRLTLPVAGAVPVDDFVIESDNLVGVSVTSARINTLNQNEIILTLDREVLNTEKLHISYSGITVSDIEGNQLIIFENKPVINLLLGSAPELLNAYTLDNLTIGFNFSKPIMQVSPTGLEIIKMPDELIEYSNASINTTDSTLVFVYLTDSLKFTDKLMVSYSGQGFESTDGGLTSNFITEISNLLAPEAPVLDSAIIDESSYKIIMYYNQLMADASSLKSYFDIKANSLVLQISSLGTAGHKIIINLKTGAFYDDVITLSYSGDKLESFEGMPAPEIDNLFVKSLMKPAITHAIPGKIEAEQFAVNQGTQTESTSDIEGGLNVGWIDSGDFLEYIVDVAQEGDYKLTFRVAANTQAGQLDIYAPMSGDEKLGTVAIPITGGWQVWTDVSTVVKLSSGKQRLRLFFAKGGCNINWFKADKYNNVNDHAHLLNSNLHVYPNPASQFLTVQTNDYDFRQIKIYDVTGKVVLSKSVSQCNFTTIDIQSFNNGCYYIEVSGMDGKLFQKFLKHE